MGLAGVGGEWEVSWVVGAKAGGLMCFVGAAAEPGSRMGSAEWIVVEGRGMRGGRRAIAFKGGVLPKNRDRELQVNKRTE